MQKRHIVNSTNREKKVCAANRREVKSIEQISFIPLPNVINTCEQTSANHKKSFELPSHSANGPLFVIPNNVTPVFQNSPATTQVVSTNSLNGPVFLIPNNPTPISQNNTAAAANVISLNPVQGPIFLLQNNPISITQNTSTVAPVQGSLFLIQKNATSVAQNSTVVPPVLSTNSTQNHVFVKPRNKSFISQKSSATAPAKHVLSSNSVNGKISVIPSKRLKQIIRIDDSEKAPGAAPAPNPVKGKISVIPAKQLKQTISTNAAEKVPNSLCNAETLFLLREIVEYQKLLDARISNIEETMADKNEMITLSKLIRECNDLAKNVEQVVCYRTGNIVDDEQIDIASTLPLYTVDAMLEVEEKLKCEQYEQAMKKYLHYLKDNFLEIDTVVRKVFSDDLLKHYNWDGRWGKYSLLKLQFISSTFFDIFQEDGRKTFEKAIKKSVERSHNRLKQKTFAKQKTLDKVLAKDILQ